MKKYLSAPLLLFLGFKGFSQETFRNDSQYALKKVKANGSGLRKDGIPISSKYIIKVDFKLNTYNHD